MPLAHAGAEREPELQRAGRGEHGGAGLGQQGVPGRPPQLPQRGPGQGAAHLLRAAQGIQPRQGLRHGTLKGKVVAMSSHCTVIMIQSSYNQFMGSNRDTYYNLNFCHNVIVRTDGGIFFSKEVYIFAAAGLYGLNVITFFPRIFLC